MSHCCHASLHMLILEENEAVRSQTELKGELQGLGLGQRDCLGGWVATGQYPGVKGKFVAARATSLAQPLWPLLHQYYGCLLSSNPLSLFPVPKTKRT